VTPTPEQLRLDRQVCFALYAASRAITREYASLLAPTGLTYPQYLVLLVLWEEAPDPVTVGELGRRLDLDSGTLTPLLKRLEAAGHVRRVRDRADERRVLVELTDRGRSLRDELASVPLALCARLGVTPAEAEALRASLTDLTAVLAPAAST
jgi:DNA-binding MarR family transcriptional regulator